MNETEQIQMAYLSFATFNLKEDADSEIEKILDEANENNSRSDITGKLIYRGGIFVQLLEGEKDRINSLLGRILLDNGRHENLRVLFKQPLIERVFPNWSMAYKKIDNVALDFVNSILPWQQLVSTSTQGSQVSAANIVTIMKELGD